MILRPIPALFRAILPACFAGLLASAPAIARDGLAWQTTRNLDLPAEPSDSIHVKDTHSFMARVPITGDAPVVSAEAGLHPAPGAKGWVALGIGNPQLGSPPWGKGVYAILDPDGRYILAASDDPSDWQSRNMTTLRRGAVPEFSPDRPVKLKIEYDRPADTVSLWAGGQLVADAISLAGHGVTVEPFFAGVSGLGQPPGHPVAREFLIGAPSADNSAPATLEATWFEPTRLPAWWNQGEPPAFRLAGEPLASDIVSIKALLTTVEGEAVAEFAISRADAERQGWNWPSARPGFYEVEFRAVDRTRREFPLARVFEVRAATTRATAHFPRTRQGFAVLPLDPLDTPGRQSKGQFGFTYTLKQENIPLARLIGLDLANIHPIPWGATFSNARIAIELERGRYRWDLLDPHVDALTAAGMTIAGQFCYTPLWASPHPEKTNINICVVEGTTYAPADMRDYSRFVEAVIRRYGDRIRLWELWNEPAIPGGSIFWSDTTENYVRLMEAGYTTIKRLQPDSEVWIGGLGSRSAYYAFYNRIQKLGAAPFYDMLSLHGTFPDRGWHEFRRIDALQNVPAKPAVVSEWHAILQGNMQSTPILAEDALSFRLLRDLAQQLKTGIRRTVLFELSNLTEKEALGFARENKWFTHSSGLFRSRPQPEPRHAAVVMANFLRATGREARVVREFPLPGDAFALHLDTARGPLALIWSEGSPLDAATLLPFATSSSTLVDWEGRTIPFTRATRAALAPRRFYYLTAPDTAVIARLPASDKVVSEQVAARARRTLVEATYAPSPLFATIDAPLATPPAAWITTGWETKSARASGFSARAAVGASDAGLDLVVEVSDSVHFQQETRDWWNGDSLQIAIDCEGQGVNGGNTELLAALTPSGPVFRKILAADPLGDIPARWTPAGTDIRHAALRIERDALVTRYRLRVEWSELYPLVHDNGKPLRLSLAVNNNDGSGRSATLEWGSGIVAAKDPSAYGVLRPAR